MSQAITAGYRQMTDGGLSPIDWYEAMSKAASEIPAKIADFFGADSTEIALTMSTGDGFVMVLGGLRWEPGDEVLITSEEHPVPLQAVQGLADREGAVIKEVELDPRQGRDPRTGETGHHATHPADLLQSRHHRFGHRAAG